MNRVRFAGLRGRSDNFGLATRRGYVTALVIGGMLSIIAFSVLANETAAAPKQSAVINLAARQGVEVERVVDLGRELVAASTPGDRSDSRKLLRRVAVQLAVNIDRLQDRALNPGDWPPPAVRSLNRDAPDFVTRRTREFVAHALALADTPDRGISRINSNFIYAIDMHDSLVFSLNRIVDAYVADGESHQKRLMLEEGLALFVILSMLLGESFFIFRPMEREIARREVTLLAQLATSNDRERQLELLLEQLPAIVWTTDADLSITSIAGAALAELKIDPASLHGQSALAWFEAVDSKSTISHERAFRGDSVEGYRLALRGRWFQIHLESRRDIDGGIVGVIGVALDVSDHEHLIHQLQAGEANLARAQRASHLGSWERSVHPAQVTWSDELFRLVGLVPQEFTPVEETAWKYIHPDDLAAVRAENLRARAHREAYTLDCRIIRSSGEVRWVNHQGEFHFDVAGELIRFVGTALDITERKIAEERVAYQVNHDALTGLSNRTLLIDRLTQAIALAKRSNRRVAVLFVDIDNFKNINDSLGHAAGDRFLNVVADRLRHSTRESDTIARTGGDEFVVVLSDIVATDDVLRVVEAVTASLSTVCNIDGHDVSVTASIGISFFNDDGSTPEEVIRHADMAMYQAKEAGRNEFRFFTPAMHENAVRRLSLDIELRRAIDRKEFVLYYQPIVVASTGCIMGVEALVRWDHPTLGIVEPDAFIPTMEASGMIVTIGDWLLRTACAQAQSWRANGSPDIRLSINVSARQLRGPSLLQVVTSALAESRFDARLLELEITESAMMSEIEPAVKMMQAFRALGIRVSIDDFGTGYSSMAYLKSFPVDTLKIDRGFVTDVPGDRGAAAIVRAVTTLAHDLALEVVAEGVETAEQADFLKRVGCDTLQGYLFSRPLPPAALESAFPQSFIGPGARSGIPVLR